MNRCQGRSLILALTVMAGLLCPAGSGHAEPSADDKALATLLFQEGRTLMSEGRVSEACPKLEESQRLDPSGGTILNLALCHEREGRLARSWSEFKEAMIVARRDARRDREMEAANHVSALEPRLSRLTIVVPPGARVEGLVIERDGREVGPGAWATPVPVDGGPHVVRATAPGREAFATTIDVAKESDTRTVEIPVLATPVVVVSGPRVLATPAAPPLLTPARLRGGGIAAAGAGVVLLGTAGYALAMALRAKDASNTECWSDGCSATGVQRRSDAVSRGNLATVLGVSGGLLVAAGATMFYLGRRSSAPSTPARSSAQAHLVFDAGPGTLVTAIGGRF